MCAPGRRIIVLTSLLVVCPLGCAADEEPFEPPASVVEYMTELRLAAEDGDGERLRALGRAVLPTADDLRRVLNPQHPRRSNLIERAERGWSRARGEAVVRALLAGRPEQTEVVACSATTQELAAYEPGSAAWRDFRREMSVFAKTHAAPGVTWIKVQRVEPGASIGMPIYGFVQLDDRYVYLGTPWQMATR